MPSLSSRFFLALATLLVAVGVAGVLAYRGLDDVQSANTQVYSNNFLTAQDTSALAVNLSAVETLGLRIVSARDESSALVLRTQLDQIAIPAVNAGLARFLAIHRGDPRDEAARVRRVATQWHRFLDQRESGPLSDTVVAGAADRATATASVAGSLDPLVAYVARLQPVESNEAMRAHERAASVFRSSRTLLFVAGVIALLAALAMIGIGLLLRTLVEEQAVEQGFGEQEGEYIDTLQVTENEDEAQELLSRHVERSIDGARAIVLARNNSADRLEPKTSLAELDAVRDALVGAMPRSCLAVRFGRTHFEGGAREPLMSCEICGALPGSSSCEPLLVSGEVIGAVLVNKGQPLVELERRRLREAVGQAAPVLANLRNLAIAELRAATDALTGLPNQRAVQDTLKRMVAQATRTMSPLAALLLDLDHFKQVNDVHGHDRGDEVLAAVGVALRNVVRDSDFVGRYGGEEFLVLLPATDQEGAVLLGEAIRRSIGAITVPGLEQRVTASVGVALLPQDGGDSVTLFRSADRALYSAKRNGRDRLETAGAIAQDGVVDGVVVQPAEAA
jgi:diguanylate cyclase (GGDEF)-like protein